MWLDFAYNFVLRVKKCLVVFQYFACNDGIIIIKKVYYNLK